MYYKLDIKPFEGGNMRQYVKRFVIECDTKKVPVQERASYLRSKLDGDAFNTFDRLPEAAKNTNDFDAFCNTLYAKFNNPAQLSNARKQFDHLQQEESSVADYARRVYDLGLMSLDPTIHRDEERNDLIKQKFISGLRPELQGFVRTFVPLTFDEAKHYALSLEADTIVNLSRRVETLTKQFERMQAPGTPVNLVGYAAQSQDPREEELIKLRQRVAELEDQNAVQPIQQQEDEQNSSCAQDRRIEERECSFNNRSRRRFGNQWSHCPDTNAELWHQVTCYNCGRFGHYARECWRPKAYQQQQQWHSSYYPPRSQQAALGSYAVQNPNPHVAYQQPQGQYQPQYQGQYSQQQLPRVDCPLTQQQQSNASSSSAQQQANAASSSSQSWFQVTQVNCGPHDQAWTQVHTEANKSNEFESQHLAEGKSAVNPLVPHGPVTSGIKMKTIQEGERQKGAIQYSIQDVRCDWKSAKSEVTTGDQLITKTTNKSPPVRTTKPRSMHADEDKHVKLQEKKSFLQRHWPSLTVTANQRSIASLKLPCNPEEAAPEKVKEVLETMTSRNQQGFLVKEILKLKQQFPQIDTTEVPKVHRIRGGRQNRTSKRAVWLANALWHAGLLSTTVGDPQEQRSQKSRPKAKQKTRTRKGTRVKRTNMESLHRHSSDTVETNDLSEQNAMNVSAKTTACQGVGPKLEDKVAEKIKTLISAPLKRFALNVLFNYDYSLIGSC